MSSTEPPDDLSPADRATSEVDDSRVYKGVGRSILVSLSGFIIVGLLKVADPSKPVPPMAIAVAVGLFVMSMLWIYVESRRLRVHGPYPERPKKKRKW